MNSGCVCPLEWKNTNVQPDCKDPNFKRPFWRFSGEMSVKA